jgi:hypothetical protein
MPAVVLAVIFALELLWIIKWSAAACDSHCGFDKNSFREKELLFEAAEWAAKSRPPPSPLLPQPVDLNPPITARSVLSTLIQNRIFFAGEACSIHDSPLPSLKFTAAKSSRAELFGQDACAVLEQFSGDLVPLGLKGASGRLAHLSPLF